MDYTRLPQHVIEAQTGAIEHDTHRTHLELQLGRLANTQQTLETTSERFDVDSHNSVQHHAELISTYFKRASDTLGPEATEEKIWENIFDAQIEDLRSEEYDGDKDILASNVLVGILFSTYGLDEDTAHTKLKNAMWNIAANREGLTVIGAANKHHDLCVATGREDKPYESILEPTKNFSALFMLTDKSVDFDTVNIPLKEELKDANPNQLAWLFGVLSARNNIACVETNLPHVPDKNALIDGFITTGRSLNNMLQKTSLGAVIDTDTLIGKYFQYGKSPLYGIGAENMDIDQRTRVFDWMLENQPNSLQYSMNNFVELPLSCLQKLIDSGYIHNNSSTDIEVFKNIPSNMMEDLQLAGINSYQIMKALPNFDIEDQKKFVQKLLDNNDPYIVLSHPDKVTFMTKDELIEIARETFSLGVVADHINKYTDGADKNLILELVDSDKSDEIARKIGDLPNLDVEWFVHLLDDRNELESLAYCIEVYEDYDQKALFDRIIEHGDADKRLRFVLKKFTSVDRDYMLEQMLDAGAFETILNNSSYFENETKESLVAKMGDSMTALHALAEEIEFYSFVDKIWLMEKLAEKELHVDIVRMSDTAINSGIDPEVIWRHVASSEEALTALLYRDSRKLFQSIGAARIMEAMLDKGLRESLAFNLDKNPDPEFHRKFLLSCIESQDAAGIRLSISKSVISRHDIAKMLCESGFETPMIGYDKENFFDEMNIPLDQIPSQADLEAWGGHAVLLAYMDRFPNIDVQFHYAQLTEKGNTPSLIRLLSLAKAPPAPKVVLEHLLASSNPDTVRKYKEKFDPSFFTQEMIEKYISTGDEAFYELYAYANVKIDWIERGYEVFGKEAPPSVIFALQEIERTTDERLPDDLLQLGVKARGQAGIEQLRRTYTNLRRTLVYGAQDEAGVRELSDLATKNGLAKSILKQLTRFTNSEWGNHEDDAWDSIFRNHLDLQFLIKPLSDNYTVSEEFTIRTVDYAEFDPSKLDSDAVEKYTAIRASLDAAVEIADLPANERLVGIFGEAKDMLVSEVAKLESQRITLEQTGKTKAVEGVTAKLDALQKVLELSPKEFIRATKEDFTLFSDLKNKRLDTLLRTGTFARAIRKSPEARRIASELTGQDATAESIARLDSFVEHIVNNEVFGNYFDSDEARKTFIRNTDTTALRKQLQKIQNGASSGSTTLQLVPSRGPLMELSGHIGDACWASKYPSIASSFPNITAIAYVRNPGKSTERLVGAGMFIETTDKRTGEDVLIIRGTNPIENYINGVKVEDFFSALVKYAKQVAGGRRVGIVIDKEPGQAATNRPVLHTFLKETVKGTLTEETPALPGPNSTFNGYVLSPNGRYAHPVYYLK